ncbi:MAG: esterase-like activity of phytase family protein [Pseudomonadota bacterium]
MAGEPVRRAGLALALTLGVGVAAIGDRAATQETAPLSATQIADREETSDRGRAALVAAFEIEAASDAFGGVSGLRVFGDDLIAVSDRGNWLRFSLIRDADGRLRGVGTSVRIEPLRDAGKGALEASSADAEALAVTDRGLLWVAFERGHRIVRYDRIGGSAQAEASQLPIAGLASNGGVEGLAIDGDGALIALIEEPVKSRGLPTDAKPGSILGWRLIGGKATPFWIPRIDQFAATGADIGPDGALYLLERRYSFWTGVRLRIRRFEPLTLRALRSHPGPGAVGFGPGRTIATLGPLGPVDNMEAISVEPRSGGGLWIFVASDDNFSARQRTLLLQYAYPPR